MTERIQAMRDFFVRDKAHHRVRKEKVDDYLLARQFAADQTPDTQRAVERLCWMLAQEQPHLFEQEKIAFVRTVPNVPELFTEEEMAQLRKEHWIHEKGDVCNINVDYTKLLGCGFEAKKEELRTQMQAHPEAKDYLAGQIRILDAVEDLAERYRALAEQEGNSVVAATLGRVPKYAPRNFLEALQMFRIIHYTMWCGRNYHNTVGRFDQYMYPYFKKDLDEGVYTQESALELLEEFFLTFNRDSDLYPGMQQGDNGQSLVLGGKNPDGTDSYNLLSELCLKASLELRLIDPKINLRTHKDTPIETYYLGTELTKQGLGFPQYSNDEVVIPGLIRLGYTPDDACNYVVAACWEFIIPGKAMDIPNIEALSFTDAMECAVKEHLAESRSYEQLRSYVRKEIFRQAAALCEKVKNIYIFPAPFVSLMVDNGGKIGQDISLGAIYNNYGLHGTGLATAADSLAAIRKLVFEDAVVSKEQLLDALAHDYKGYDLLCNQLRYEMPKMGNDEDSVDEIATELLDDFADALKGKKNERGGIFRAGTGSAMYYIWHSKNEPATPDGRHSGEGIACNYSPSLFARCKGPVSIIKSFAKPHLERTINGGPLTLELHDALFRTEGSTQKVAMLVKSFMDMGGHQLQLNAVNRETMLDAQKHPENYRNLIVRVWGWSGYFVELDKEYQDHIIQRMELQV